jgi:hypothetical protein
MSLNYYSHAVDLVCDEMQALIENPDKYPGRAMKLVAVLRNAANEMRKHENH